MFCNLPSTTPRPGRKLSIKPTRNPPTRTSLPGTMSAPDGSCADKLYVGTNGNPLFALYARNTATNTTNVVTAPTNTGLATIDAVPLPRFMAPTGSRGHWPSCSDRPPGPYQASTSRCRPPRPAAGAD